MAKVKATRKNKKPVAKKSAAKKFVAKSAAKSVAKKLLAHKPAAKPAKKTAKPAAKKPLARKPIAKTAKPAPKPKATAPKKNGIPEQMLSAALKVLDERQADDIFTADVTGRSSVADYVIIASGRAGKQIAAIAHYLRDAFEKLGARQVRMEGLNEGNWVLVDSGDVIVHLFRPEVRKYYDLERIWAERSPA